MGKMTNSKLYGNSAEPCVAFINGTIIKLVKKGHSRKYTKTLKFNSIINAIHFFNSLSMWS